MSAPWSTKQIEWLLHCDMSHPTILTNLLDKSSLIDIHSNLFKSLSHSISPLESDRYLHVTRSVEDHIEIGLPRMKLSFFVNEDKQLESRNFRGQVVDEDQSAGTFFGLKNQLLLRAKSVFANSLPRARSVLVPDGEIAFALDGNHVLISIQFDSRRNVDFYRYMIDEDLGYIATDAGLTSRLFKIYLHALTSHCLPDPLLGRTGTEEALHELSQASVSSFEQINHKQATLLKFIGRLTPKLEYYPAHLNCMQTTHWVSLPSLSQHFSFSTAAQAVLRRADALQLFHVLDFDISDFISDLQSSETLLKRATQRISVLYPSDTIDYVSQILEGNVPLDNVHAGRDAFAGDWAEAGETASWASGLAQRNWRTPVFKSYHLLDLVKTWGTMDDLDNEMTLSYRSFWFSLDLKSTWIGLYNLLRQTRTSSNRYMLSACLASIAFGQRVPADLIPVLLAFATNPTFQNIDPPSRGTFRLANDGYEPSRMRVAKFVEKAAYSITSSPASKLNQYDEESYDTFDRRRQQHYDKNISRHRPLLVGDLMAQWPLVHPDQSIKLGSTESEHNKWFNVKYCVKSTGDYFTSCSWNNKLKKYFEDLEAALSRSPNTCGTSFEAVDESHMRPPTPPQIVRFLWRPVSLYHLMQTHTACDPVNITFFSKLSLYGRAMTSAKTERLRDLFTELQSSQFPLNQRYGSDLDESRRELDTKPTYSFPRNILPSTITYLEHSRAHSKANITYAFQQIKLSLSPRTDIESVVLTAGIWPRITPRLILRQLSFQHRHHMNSLPCWRDHCIEYAHMFTDYQRSRRLVALAVSQNTEEIFKELNLTNGEPDLGSNDPDWLLAQASSW
ncbi:hypothetical protein RSOLAG1IB_11530 [Rhizoctonia solani AG-1 IB]|uniref:Uncharacterized protein n=1 Tax=Thanatephorus cucumeris (strain AG1-IB / isolate 7/3/14) TaxID=1108050 RepID=A0A0B7FCU3_THACB|nr:hypothetical protein RSOLAG1IB_11530 [Rhizoctonia solani AG-1 IB]